MMKPIPEYQAQTASETIQIIAGREDPWLALGQFLDDWRRTYSAQRPGLVSEPLPDVSPEYLRWAALLAAAVDCWCAQDQIPAPSWTSRPEYRLPERWFLYPGWRLRAWQLAETPVPFRMRNILVGTASWRASSALTLTEIGHFAAGVAFAPALGRCLPLVRSGASSLPPLLPARILSRITLTAEKHVSS